MQQAYHGQLQARGYQADPAQLAAVERLQRMVEEAIAFKARRSNRLRKWLDRSDPPRGVWLWGGVGRGKSFLMDVFFEAVPLARKTRLHFHEFMRGVHRELRELRQVQDPLDEVARRIATRYRLICFDEFHVSDVADAMILERLLDGLFRSGVTFVMTSNYRPDDLYPDGLHREALLPAIALLKQQLDVLCVDAGIDYRRLEAEQAYAWRSPCDDGMLAELAQAFARIAGAPGQPEVLEIERRQVSALRRAGEVVWFDFETLCGSPRSQLDYLDIASRFHTVFLTGVPQMTAAMSSEARRFTWLVDVLYDQKVKLLVCADCAAEQLYTQGAFAHEFTRTVSRLVEMQSRDYLLAPRRGVAQGVT
ncbi:MAG: cell division protein ZapE [Burkholderiales bacterium]|jgi:cell division protein ZapE